MADDLLVQNLEMVFNERNAEERLRALGHLYVSNPALYEPDNVVEGHTAISETITRLLEHLPPGFVFTPVGASVGHHDRRCIRWRGGLPGQPALLSGVDVADLEGGKIRALYVFIDAVLV